MKPLFTYMIHDRICLIQHYFDQEESGLSILVYQVGLGLSIQVNQSYQKQEGLAIQIYQIE